MWESLGGRWWNGKGPGEEWGESLRVGMLPGGGSKLRMLSGRGRLEKKGGIRAGHFSSQDDQSFLYHMASWIRWLLLKTLLQFKKEIRRN